MYDLRQGEGPGAGHVRHRERGGVEYWIYFALVFLISLPVAAARRLLPAHTEAWGVPARRRSILGEARSMADSVTPMLFSA
jgi:hypothetical protein